MRGSKAFYTRPFKKEASGGLMEGCRGVHDWFECVSCDHLSTVRCPFEGNEIDVMVELKARLNAAVEAKAGGEGLPGVLDVRR
ncbi:hypothetical protein LCGC14_3151320 [marine sediment metagenome]|uniref:Uncharacterized protein n=1 Tax=marine sediment metagenome TaxID=412755 RepID=A0A0F8VU14_9ZZZZ